MGVWGTQHKYLSEAVGRVLVPSGIHPLHSGLHNVERVVAQRAEAAGGHAAEKVLEVRQRPGPVVADDSLVLVEPHEPQPLPERTRRGSFSVEITGKKNERQPRGGGR